MARWTQLLLSSPKPAFRHDYLGQILLKCSQPGNEDTATILFDYLTRPQSKFEESASYIFAESEEERKRAPRFSIKIEMEGNDYWLKEAWRRVFQPKLEIYAERLLPLVIRQFENAYLILRSSGDAGGNWDHISFSRSAIEPPEQNHGFNKMDLLVDVGREAMDWLLVNKIVTANANIVLLLDSPSLLLQRLGIYALMKHPILTADEKIDVVLGRGWLHSWPHHHEVYQLLRACYSFTKIETRQRLLEAVKIGPTFPQDDEETRQARDHSVYKMSVWLAESDPKCELAGALRKEEEAKHPNFRPPEYLDFTHWIGPVETVYVTPTKIDELLKISPSDAAEYINSSTCDESYNEYPGGLNDSLKSAVEKNPDWGLEVLIEFRKFEAWQEAYWKHLIYGFRNAALSEDQWEKLLTILNDTPEIHQHFLHPLAEILSNGLRRESDKIPDTELTQADNLAHSIWNRYLQEPITPGPSSMGWLTFAINHPVGKVTEFWLEYLNRTIQNTDPKHPHIPDKFKEYFTELLQSPIEVAVVAIPVLTRRLWWLYALDTKWTKERLLGFLDWDINDIRTAAAWDGYFYSRRWSQNMLEDILPLYEKSFGVFDQRFSEQMQEVFCQDIASICFYSGFNPLSDREGWILRFLSQCNAKNRVHWARNIENLLESMTSGDKVKQWNEWLNNYWELRIDGKPVPLEPKEVNQMFGWTFRLEPVFNEATNLAIRMDVSANEDQSIFSELSERDKIKLLPAEPLSRLIAHLLRSYTGQFWSYDDLTMIFDYLLQNGASHVVLRDICNSLSRLGCENALELADSIEHAPEHHST